jgi:hypothetical protein
MLSRNDEKTHNKARTGISNYVDGRRGIVLIFTAIMMGDRIVSRYNLQLKLI